MRNLLVAVTILLVVAATTNIGFAQVPTTGNATKMVPVKDQVDMELLTWNEIHDKIHKEGKTTVIIVNGGTEQRGPQDVLGGHTIMGHNKGVEVAKKLGNALNGYTVPFSLASGDDVHNGGAGLSSDLFKAVNLAEIDNMVKNGFRYIFVMGDHGGGQAEMKEVAAHADEKYSTQGVHVAYISDFYYKAHTDFEQYCYDHKIPIPSHAGVSDTSEMMYWEPAKNMYVRDIYKTVPFDPGPTFEEWKAQQSRPAGGQRGGGRGAATATVDPSKPIWIAIQGPQAPAGGGQRGGGRGDVQAANQPPRVNNGITGDPHMSSKELGKLVVDITVRDAVAEIQKYMAQWKSSQ
jgi:creatinine amidohydrolase/Fe(II)-dependent formamide hydrolase-like protein